MVSWVIGRGLLGTSVEGALSEQSSIWRAPGRLDWADQARVTRQLAAAAATFAAAAHRAPWQVAWCAGTGVTATEQPALAVETELLVGFLEALSRQPALDHEQGALFLASSAGGVYAGADEPPFTETTPARPASAYGRAKLEQERLVAAWAATNGVATLIGRIANLYGPGQDTTKPQGLISQLVLSTLLRRPTPLYVPLDTLRDYLYAADAGSLVATGLDRLRRDGAERPVVTKILASQRAVTVGAVLAEVRRTLKRQPRVVLAASPLGAAQRRDLRLRSVVWPELDRRPCTSLAEGIHAVAADLQRRFVSAGPTLVATG